jgi:nicotinamidase-related amidase
MKALLIVDMQLGSFTPYSSRHNTYQIIKNINTLIEVFDDLNFPIIFIKHDGTKENCLLPNTKDFDILPELTQTISDLTIIKEANDPFYKTELQSLLQQKDISQLYICGCATDFCVDALVKSALTKDYELFIASDAHTTANRPQVDAPTIIQYYNWIWDDMTATKHKITVSPTLELISRMK